MCSYCLCFFFQSSGELIKLIVSHSLTQFSCFSVCICSKTPLFGRNNLNFRIMKSQNVSARYQNHLYARALFGHGGRFLAQQRSHVPAASWHILCYWILNRLQCLKNWMQRTREIVGQHNWECQNIHVRIFGVAEINELLLLALDNFLFVVCVCGAAVLMGLSREKTLKT